VSFLKLLHSITKIFDRNISVVSFALVFFLGISSAAAAREDSFRLQGQGKLFEPAEGLTLMAAGDAASQDIEVAVSEDFPETPIAYTPENFERAFQEYLTRPWSVMIYQGWGTVADLGQVLLFDIKSEDSLFTGVVANRKMFSFWRYFTFELEGQILRHYKKQEHWEYNGLFLVRFHPFLLDPTFDIEIAVGEGVSYATEIPVIEAEQHPDASSRFLNYLVFEVAFTHTQYREWSLVGRIHHRSGAFRLYNGTRGGSNFLALGLRYHF
jgi:hypothetical protein